MKAKFTSGEWVAESNPGRQPVTWQVVMYVPAPGRKSRFCVAEVPSAYSEAEDIARLIAAAPRLYRALEAVVRIADWYTDVFAEARAALVQADGGEG